MLHAWGDKILATDRRMAAAFIAKNNRTLNDVTGNNLKDQWGKWLVVVTSKPTGSSSSSGSSSGSSGSGSSNSGSGGATKPRPGAAERGASQPADRVVLDRAGQQPLRAPAADW